VQAVPGEALPLICREKARKARKKGLFTANHAKNASKGNSAFAYFAYFAVSHSGIFAPFALFGG
jgi:hypothetical protein